MADDHIKTILHAVCHHGKNDVLKVLLEKGIDCTVTNSGSSNPSLVVVPAWD